MLEINLLPAELKKIHKLQVINKMVIIIAGVMVMAILVVYVSAKSELNSYQQEKIKTNNELKLLQPVQNEQNKQVAELQHNHKLAERLLAASKQRYSMHALLVHLGTLIIDDVVLTEIKAGPDGTVEISGKAADQKILLKFIKICSADRQFFRSVDLIKTAVISKKGSYQVSFVLQAVMKNGDDR